MAVHPNANTQQAQQPNPNPNPQQHQQHQQPPGGPGPDPMQSGWPAGMNMFMPGFGGNVFGSMISGDSESEVFKKFVEAIKPQYEKINVQGISLKLVEVDRSQYQDISFSALCVCAHVDSYPQHGVAYHVLLLEGSGKRLESVKETIREGYTNREIELLSPTELALDRDMMDTVSGAVMKAYGPTTLRFAGHTVVPSDFDITDESAVRRLAFVVSTATGQELATSATSFNDINIVKLVPKDARLSIDFSFDKRSTTNFVNQPVRSDVQTVFTYGRNNSQRSYRPNAPSAEWTASEVDGFIDLVPAPNGGMIHTPYGSQQTPPYVGRYIATQLANNCALTLGGVILSMCTVFPLGANENWVQAFAPRKCKPGELDLTDIGALNLDANINREQSMFGTPITDTRNADFSMEDVGRLMGLYVGKGLIFSIDCSIAGPDSWFLSSLRAVNTSQAAKLLTLESINTLTNGHFSQIFNPSRPLTMDHGNVIHMGHWFDANRVKRDIREFDLVAVCNLLGKTEPALIRKWLETFYNTSIPQAIRLSRRWDMIMAMSNDTAVCTGMAERVTLSNDLVLSCMAAMFATQIPVSVRTPLSAGEFSYQRPSADFVSGALVQGMPTFQQPTYGSGNGFAYNTNNYRWG